MYASRAKTFCRTPCIVICVESSWENLTWFLELGGKEWRLGHAFAGRIQKAVSRPEACRVSEEKGSSIALFALLSVGRTVGNFIS